MKLGLLPLFKPESFGPQGFSATGLEYFSANTMAEIVGFIEAYFPQIQVILKLSLKDFLHAQPDLALIWATSPCFGQVQPTAENIKAFLNIPVWLGGPHISYAPQTLPDAIDLAIIGEVELPLQQLLTILLKQPDAGPMQFRRVPGIIYQSRGRIYSGQPAQLIPQLSKLPQPNFRIFQSLPGFSAPVVRSARCSDNLLTALAYPPARKVRLQHPEHLCQQFEQLADNYATAYRSLPLRPDQLLYLSPVFIPDYQFMLYRQRLEALVPMYSGRKLNERIFLIPNLTPEAAHRETFDLLKELGTRRLLFQFGPLGQQNPLLPDWTPDSLAAMLELCKRYQFGVIGNFFLNPDVGTTRHQLAQTYLVLRDQAKSFDQLQVSLLGMMPGVPAWDQYLAKHKPEARALAALPWANLDWEKFSEQVPLFHTHLDRVALREMNAAFRRLKIHNEPLLNPLNEEIFIRMRSRLALEFLYKYWAPGQSLIEVPVWPETAIKSVTPSLPIHQFAIRKGQLAGAPPPENVDLIVLSGTLNAVREPEAILRQLKGYLKPEGKMFIQLMNPLSYPLLDNFFNWNTDHSFAPHPLLKFIKEEEMAAMLARCGLDVIETDYNIMANVEAVRQSVETLAARLEYHASLRIPQHMLYVSDIKMFVRNRSV